jgi:TonB family protein
MQGFGPSIKAVVWGALRIALSVVVTTCFSAVSWCSVGKSAALLHRELPLSQLERTLRAAPSHIAEFASFSLRLQLPRCRVVSPPEALLTPDPLLPVQDDDLKVRVSFIIGADGHVHSAYILDSGGPEEDERILRVIRFWRYRPALCNGIPTDSEALVRFILQ